MKRSEKSGWRVGEQKQEEMGYGRGKKENGVVLKYVGCISQLDSFNVEER